MFGLRPNSQHHLLPFDIHFLLFKSTARHVSLEALKYARRSSDSSHHNIAKPRAYLPKLLLPRPDPHRSSIHNLAGSRCARKRTISTPVGILPGVEQAERRPAPKPNMDFSVHHERSRSMSITPPVQRVRKSNTSSYRMRRSKITLDVDA